MQFISDRPLIKQHDWCHGQRLLGFRSFGYVAEFLRVLLRSRNTIVTQKGSTAQQTNGQINEMNGTQAQNHHQHRMRSFVQLRALHQQQDIIIITKAIKKKKQENLMRERTQKSFTKLLSFSSSLVS